jgi:two-component system, cell cycle response regulator DivK
VAKALEIRPDLILIDIQLPNISGIEAMRRLRAEPSTAATPIIAITSFALFRPKPAIRAPLVATITPRGPGG